MLRTFEEETLNKHVAFDRFERMMLFVMLRTLVSHPMFEQLVSAPLIPVPCMFCVYILIVDTVPFGTRNSVAGLWKFLSRPPNSLISQT